MSVQYTAISHDCKNGNFPMKNVIFILFLLKSYMYLPLQIWTLKICIHDISKSITARSFKLGELKEDDE